MKYQNIIALSVAFVFIGTATLVTTPLANADCSYGGYINSNGQCSDSYIKNTNYYYQPQFQNQNTNRLQTNFGFNDQAITAMIERLQAMIAILESLLEQGTIDDSKVSVTTRTAINIDNDSATLRGRVFLDNDDEAEVYFEYGESRTNLDEETPHEFFDDNDDAYTFEEGIYDLEDNTIYYFRAVAEDGDGDEDYGVIYSFRTDESDLNDFDLPDLDTREANSITEDKAEINGYVDMNDYDDGKIFFVYGEDESDVEDVADDYDRYVDIDEQGHDLQKTPLDGELDGSSYFQEVITNLDNDTRIYYSICVEFDDEDNDPLIMCGNTESFKTDNN